VTWVTFTPCFLWVFLGAPYVEALRGARGLSAALSAVTAAVVGVILNLAVWFGIHVIFKEMTSFRGHGLALSVPVPASLDPWALAIALGAMIAIFGLRVGMIPTLLISSVAGVALHLAFGAG
jgi:chromate transporter